MLKLIFFPYNKAKEAKRFEAALKNWSLIITKQFKRTKMLMLIDNLSNSIDNYYLNW